MLPTGDDAENMEQSTLNYVFTLFGKGVTQMLQQNVNQQTTIDELRSQIRSLQTQVANLTAAMDEVEDRIFVRLQNMQPTIYTREGIPIDDALDMINSKMTSINEKIINNSEALSKVDTELTAKVDRDEWQASASETAQMSESFSEVCNTIQSIQKEMAKQRQESEEANERIMKSIKFQIESHSLHTQMNGAGIDLSNYVTKDELKKELATLKVSGGGSNKGDINSSAVVEFALSGGITDEKKINEAYRLLKRRKKNLDMNYNKETDIINEEMSKLMRLAKNARKDDPNYLENEEEEEEEEEDSQRKAEKGKGNENLIDDDGNDDDDEIPVEKEYRNIGLDTEEHIEIEETEIRTENKAPKRRHIGLSVKRRVKKTKPSKDSSGKEQQQDNESEADLDDEDDEPDIEVEEDEGRSKKNPRKRKKVKKGISGLITKMKKTQKKNQNQQAGTQQVVARIDEGKVTQRVLEAVMPRVENLLIDTFSGSNGIGGNGVKLEKNDAKQLITQLSLLDSMKNEVKGLRLKLAMKIDRVKAENELRIRITKDEFFQYLSAFFPENETIKQMVQQPKTSKLPPLNSRKPNIGGNPMSNSSLGQSAENPVTYTKNKQMAKSNLVMRPNRNSNMIALNQKFLKGADGHYYLRDMTTDPNSIQAVQGSMFGENSEDVDINAVLDFQPFKQVSTDDHDIRVNPNVVKVHREETPEV